MRVESIRRAAIAGSVAVMGFGVLQLLGGGHGTTADDTLVAVVLFMGLASAGTLAGRVAEGLRFTSGVGVVGAFDALVWMYRDRTGVSIACGVVLLVISLGLVVAERQLRKAAASEQSAP